MRVRSPIGDLPFTVTGVRRGGAGSWSTESWAPGRRRSRSARVTCRCWHGRCAARCGRRVVGAAALLAGEPAVSRDVLIGIDQGTSGTRTVAFDLRLRPLADAYRPAEVSHPQPGWI